MNETTAGIMENHYDRLRFIMAVVLIAGATAAPGIASAQQKTHQEEHMPSTTKIQIPESMRAEHKEIHEALVRATKLDGKVGVAARELAAVLHPHFQREEEIALPPLGLLAPLARGESTPDMRDVLRMTDALRAELPRMLEAHKAISAATVRLRDVARSERNPEVERLADQLLLHARGEEELFYPAAILVGDVVRARMNLVPR
jgi:hypothetical protein